MELLRSYKRKQFYVQATGFLLVISIILLVGTTLRLVSPAAEPQEAREHVAAGIAIALAENDEFTITERYRIKVDQISVTKRFCRTLRPQFLDSKNNLQPLSYELLWKEEGGEVAYISGDDTLRHATQICFGKPVDGVELLQKGNHEFALQYVVKGLVEHLDNGGATFDWNVIGAFEKLPVSSVSGQITLPLTARGATIQGAIHSLSRLKTDRRESSPLDQIKISPGRPGDEGIEYSFEAARQLQAQEFIMLRVKMS